MSLGVTPGPGILDQIIPEAIVAHRLKRPDLKFRVRSGTISELLVEPAPGDLDLLFTVLDERDQGTRPQDPGSCSRITFVLVVGPAIRC